MFWSSSDSGEKINVEDKKGVFVRGERPSTKNEIDKNNENEKGLFSKWTEWTSEGGESAGVIWFVWTIAAWLGSPCDVSLRCVHSLPWIAARRGKRGTPTGKCIEK